MNVTWGMIMLSIAVIRRCLHMPFIYRSFETVSVREVYVVFIVTLVKSLFCPKCSFRP